MGRNSDGLGLHVVDITPVARRVTEELAAVGNAAVIEWRLTALQVLVAVPAEQYKRSMRAKGILFE